MNASKPPAPPEGIKWLLDAAGNNTSLKLVQDDNGRLRIIERAVAPPTRRSDRP
jgi:hypothetical protein